jgi:hypothetical protein
VTESDPYSVKKLGKTKLFSIILSDLGDVYLLRNGKKGDKLDHAFHTCANPQQPRFGDLLSLAGLIDVDVDLRGPARYVPRHTKGWGFYFSPNHSIGKRGTGDWEAADSGGRPGKKGTPPDRKKSPKRIRR